MLDYVSSFKVFSCLLGIKAMKRTAHSCLPVGLDNLLVTLGTSGGVNVASAGCLRRRFTLATPRYEQYSDESHKDQADEDGKPEVIRSLFGSTGRHSQVPYIENLAT
jgi:hypothetical protein